MNSKYIKSLLLTVLCSTGALLFAAGSRQASIATARDAFSVETRQQKEVKAEEFVKRGNEFFVAGNYHEAGNSYAHASYIYEELAPKSEYFTEKWNKTREMTARARYYQAQEKALKAQESANYSDLEAAIKLCREAAAIYPPAGKEMRERIEVYEKMRKAAVKRSRLNEDQVITDRTSRSYEINVLLKKAKMLYYAKKYEDAHQQYRQVLLIDNLCPEAIQGMRACDVQLRKAADDRFRLTHKKAVAEAAWATVTPILKDKSVNLDDVRTELDSLAPQRKKVMTPEEEATSGIRKKLAELKIPRVSFGGGSDSAGLSLPKALQWLTQRSKEVDPERKGVNFFLYYPETAEEREAAANKQNEQAENTSDDEGDGDDEGDEEGDGEGEGQSEQNQEDTRNYPQVTLDLENKPLLEVVKTLANAADMKYKIERNAVVFAPKNAPLDDMQIKVFMFDEDMLEALGGSSESEALKENFMMAANGVSFPEGSNVMYDPKFRSLIVLNTPENLAKIADTLEEIRTSDPQPMIQIQAKFVEIEQSDLKELGFIQSLGRPNGDMGETNGRLQFSQNDETVHNSHANTFVFSTGRDGYGYNLTINAINQLSSKDVLSSPKVLTNPQKKVTIKMTNERYFEWDYEEGEFNITNSESGSTYSYTPPWPDFEKEELGITMDIKPTIVDRKKRLIQLDVHPWVRTLVGWSEYEYIVSADGGEGSTTELMTRPIIAERTTMTNVVVADNETVVVGGIIKDYTITIDDKIPVLGDIPLLGNFFKSKSSSIKKTNMLIFITARMVKPDGQPYYSVDPRGRPSSAGIGDIY